VPKGPSRLIVTKAQIGSFTFCGFLLGCEGGGGRGGFHSKSLIRAGMS
jgi:hypothetical protein